MADGQVLIEITADNRDVKQTLRDTTNELTSAGQKWEKQGDAMSGVFKKIAGSITAAGIGKALLSIGKDAVEAASKLEEVQNVVDVTFGESSKEIDRWAKDAIKQFGLTETQAKQFTSTLGAMMKSSGVSGNEIVKMSTDLSGLAADMASFYNLDFETAFQKIRSGISGETEPLKQLGINMSVVNLEAFAMTQGITKSFQEMSQGEQVMLRYQYIMQATADAQGDFARTSDGFANATRLLESNLDSLKTKLGGPLMEGFNRVLGKINEVVDAITGDTGQRTILDRFTEIDQEKESKLAEVRNTAQTARELVGILEGLENDGFHVTALEEFASGANLLNSSSPANWRNVLSALQTNIGGVEKIWDENEPGKNINDLALALSGLNGGTSKAQAWQIMLHALSDNAEGIARMSGMSTDEVRALLDKFAADASKIDEGDAAAWDRLFTSFAQSFPSIITSTALRAMGQNIGGVATGANMLDSSSPANWRNVLSALENNIGGMEKIWDESEPGKNVEDLANALSGLSGGTSKAQAWQIMLHALADNADGIASLSGMSTGDVRALLDKFATDAGEIDENDAEAWDRLFTAFAQSFPTIITSTTLRALGQNIRGVADGAKVLDSTSTSNWRSLLNTFENNLGGVERIWDETDPGKNVEDLAQALSGLSAGLTKAQAWQMMLQALSDNAEGIARMSGMSTGDVRALLDRFAADAGMIDEDDAQAWDLLFTTFATSFPSIITSTTLRALGQNIGGIATNANGLRASSQANWEKFAQALEGIDGLTNIWTGSADGVEGLAQALSNRGITQSRAQAWRTMIDALKENIGVVSEIHGANEADTTTWLEGLADAAMQLSPANAEAWDTLFGWLVQGLPGLSQTPEGQALINALNGAAELTNGGPGQPTTEANNGAVEVMEMLGIATDDVNDKQQLWLATCRELVKQIPTLSRIINTETGEIIGGAAAVREYVDAWEAQSVQEIYINALRQKMSELESEMHASRSNATVARTMARSLLGENIQYSTGRFGAAPQTVSTEEYLNNLRNYSRQMFANGVSVKDIQNAIDNGAPLTDISNDANGAFLQLIGLQSSQMTEAGKKAAKDCVTAFWDEWYGETVIPEAQREFAAEVQRVTEEGIATMDDLVDKYGEVTDAAEDAASAQSQLSDDQKKSWDDAIDAAIKAIEAVKAYEEQMISAARSTLRGWGNVFDEVQTKDEKTLHDIEKALEDFEGDRTAEFNVRVGTSDIVSAQNMLANLQNRAARYREYGNTLQALQSMGYSDDVLSQFANGDLNNLDYMRQLMRAGGNSEYVTQVNEAFQQMKETENDLAEFLAEQARKTDEGYKKVVDAAEQAMNAFDSMTATDAPAIAIGETIDNVIKTIETKYPVLQNKLHLLQNAVWSLQFFGNRDVNGKWSDYYSPQGVTGGHRSVAGGTVVGSGYSFIYDGSHADGLGFVPFDGYIAQLHRGESVLTAEEAQIWREFRSGIDANSLAGAIWDNSPDLGGNVYLNGEIVGRIMSGAQADSYRQLERSGWRG